MLLIAYLFIIYHWFCTPLNTDSTLLHQLSTADSTLLHQLSTADSTLLHHLYLLLIAHFFVSYLLLIAHFFISYLLLIAHFFICYLLLIAHFLHRLPTTDSTFSSTAHAADIKFTADSLIQLFFSSAVYCW